ncbi:50S ribosomal protein L25 [Siccirubricoccus deserti]|uniref:Large ribosomal subunit protein bL25 n=1 Tax=Siccirubricoccus deserti TaxID=2013562 RepID=A0A9X0UIH6_9PROT|nr:50S ribosomal protein L25/general stress protein Ctc [Siccirubricoccus deserti]MBC4017110.1 50S ribosomal protein L25/general stress protein Ctc [Siccirubricoccus deserti]GGC56878.1 50S ribosomal protein L25 [Siccirubricoccus deserti]
MVQTIRIEAESRGRAGKGAARATRREGLVPAVIYGAKQEATLIALDPRDVMKELHKGGWQSHLYEVAVKGGGTERTLMRDVQFHPVTDRPIHVDFQRLAAGQKIRVKVAVSFLNEATSPGLKAGGVLNLVRRDIEVYADPDAVPEGFEIDLGEAGIGDSLRWSAVKDSFGTKPVIDRDFVVATIAAPTVVEEAPAAAAPAAPEATKQKAPAAKAPAKKK